MNNYLHPHYADCLIKNIKMRLWTLINYSVASYWRIKLGSGVRFNGKVYFNTLPKSKVFVGSNCIFNSSITSNMIGVYTPCMISTLSNYAEIRIGTGCGFSGTVIAAAKQVIIGDNVRCGANTMITDTDWHTDDYRAGIDAPVVIENNVWLGYGVKILKGVTIGKNSLIGACSVVTRDVPPNCIASGVPCRVVRNLDNESI